MKMIWNEWKIKENCHVLVDRFHGNINSKTLCCRQIKSVFRDVKWWFNASWGLKGLTAKLFNFYTHEIAGEADDDFTRSTDPWCPERGDTRAWSLISRVQCFKAAWIFYHEELQLCDAVMCWTTYSGRLAYMPVFNVAAGKPSWLEIFW